MADTPSPTRGGSRTGLSNLNRSLFRSLPGVEQAATGHRVFGSGTGELLAGSPCEGDATMPVCRQEDGGGVVANGPAVMAGTG